ncbi:sensor histidine kinase [Pseudosulfitobacter koreensis]|uniref:histidine kinase n=1 Tax=Pseudosulfitobacter koreensis TaxID=2968472 RepID=A0ABT1Z4I7_9RHOB|nr:GAF domain-containing sensor histidine kinase [Pseudosulfitobacter koreense]MCR8828028.1 GAF domain-containing sensor histidine kinase [Pseudosulfitobacter koreense]
MNDASIRFPFGPNEHSRLKEVREVLGAEKHRDPILQKVVERVRGLFDSPTALVSVVESDHQWFLAKVGVDIDAMPRDYSICSRTILSDVPLILPDARAHKEFATHPAVALEPHIRFYAGAPIVLSSGFRVGSLCAVDVTPHAPPSDATINELVTLADDVAAHLEMLHAQRTAGDRSARTRIASEAQLEFLSLVGHELRTPLTILLGNARLLQTRVTGKVEQRMVNAVEASGVHLHQLIEHIIRYSNLDSGERTLADDSISCLDLLHSAATPVAPISNAVGREIHVHCDEDIDVIYADAEQLILALSCLITNSVKHGRGAIEVSARMGDAGTLRLAVYDHGEGLPVDQLRRADQPFTIGEDVDTRTTGGLGLGLPLAKKIAQLHGGALLTGREDPRAFVELRLPSWRCQGYPA